MWYEDSKIETIQEDKPIFATSCIETYVLLPQIGKDYVFMGFNWFNMRTGTYNSCKFFQSMTEAINSYSHYNIYNGELRVDKVE